MVLRWVAVVLAALTGVVAGGCAASPGSAGPLPDGRTVADTAAEALAGVDSVRFDFHTRGAMPGLPVRQVEGVATRTGGPYGFARGQADVQGPTGRVQYDFVLDGDVLRLGEPGSLVGSVGPGRATAEHGTDGGDTGRGDTGGGDTGRDTGGGDAGAGAGAETVREWAVPELVAPGRLLDPATGLGTLLRQARDLKTETREDLDDVATYRVGGELPRAVVASFVPGVHADVEVKFWVGADEPVHLRRVWIQVPPRTKNEGAVVLELALTRHDVAVSSATGDHGVQRVPSGGSVPSTR